MVSAICTMCAVSTTQTFHNEFVVVSLSLAAHPYQHRLRRGVLIEMKDSRLVVSTSSTSRVVEHYL